MYHRLMFSFILAWLDNLPSVSLRELSDNESRPRSVAIVVEDMVKGFTSVGGLASPRIAGVVPKIVRLLVAAHEIGVRDVVLPQDSHPPDSPEFDAYGPHCVTGTIEAETIDEIASLPFFHEFTVMPKESLNPFIGTDLGKWVDDRPEIEHVIVVGDCTDLCVYQAATQLKIRANAKKRKIQVIVAEDCVQTYHLGVEEALAAGVTPHDGDLMHTLFLYHMALNDIKIVRHIG